jgi:23S rRNA maturation mini-RNase III
MELKEELHNIGLAFVWRKQQDWTLRKMTKTLRDRCNDIERQNSLAKFSEKSTLTLYREMNFFWSKNLYIEWCLRKERSRIAWLPAWQLKGLRTQIKEDATYV